MPELPEVQALAADLGTRLTGRTIVRFDVTAFSALKTYDPPVSALEGGTITGVARHGKYLDIVVVPSGGGAPLHIVMHLARAGWIRWRENAPTPGVGRGKGPLAARLVLGASPGAAADRASTSRRRAPRRASRSTWCAIRRRCRASRDWGPTRWMRPSPRMSWPAS